MRYDDDMKARLSIVYDETWGDQDQVDHDDDEIDENLLVRVRMMQDMRYEDDDMIRDCLLCMWRHWRTRTRMIRIILRLME